MKWTTCAIQTHRGKLALARTHCQLLDSSVRRPSNTLSNECTCVEKTIKGSFSTYIHTYVQTQHYCVHKGYAWRRRHHQCPPCVVWHRPHILVFTHFDVFFVYSGEYTYLICTDKRGPVSKMIDSEWLYNVMQWNRLNKLISFKNVIYSS